MGGGDAFAPHPITMSLHEDKPPPLVMLPDASDSTNAASEAAASKREEETRLRDEQQAAITMEVEAVPMVGPRSPLNGLVTEYEAQGSKIFADKTRALLDAGFSAMRRSRGDGDCFYRSLLFVVLEKLCATHDAAGIAALKARVSDMADKFVRAGYQPMVVEDPVAALVRMVDGCAVWSADELVAAFCSNELTPYAMWALRLITATEMKVNADFYSNFLDVPVPVYVDTAVEPVHSEADHVCIAALCAALQLRVRVLYLDAQPGPPTDTSVGDDACPLAATLLYRPGHYDVLL